MTQRLVAVLVLLAAAVACGGGPASESALDRTIDVEMRATRYHPDAVTVDRGSTVTFRFSNRDPVAHDAFVGDAEAQKAHEKEMREEGEAHDHGAGEDGITVRPGQTDELVYTFERSGQLEVACHQPGHYAGGMVMKVTVR